MITAEFDSPLPIYLSGSSSCFEKWRESYSIYSFFANSMQVTFLERMASFF
ncbi:unnamed protein product, partial [Mycena citricolor]